MATRKRDLSNIKLADLRTAERILIKSLRDISAGKWVCGVLSTFGGDIDGRKKPKVMGCAIGLVSLNGKETLQNRIPWMGGFITVESATYPDQNWKDSSLLAAQYLVLGTTAKNRHGDRYIERTYEALKEGFYNRSLDADGYVAGRTTPAAISDAVVATNDESECGINSPRTAAQWFTRALKLVQKDIERKRSEKKPKAAKASAK